MNLFARLSRVLSIVAGLFFIVLLLFAIPTFFDPEFEVHNQSSEPVMVTAQWREQHKDLGELLPGATHHFSLDDEAAITFTVRYASGREIVSEPEYFTAGVTVIATISDERVEVRYDFES